VIVDDDAAKVGDGLHQALEAVIPVGRDLEYEHDALVGEAKLEIADFADVVDEIFGVIEILRGVVGKALVAELVEQDGDVGLFEDDFTHGDERRTGRLGVFYEVLPAVGVFLFEDDRWNFFCDVGIEPTHAVASDKRHHVVFERDKIVRLHSIVIVSETPVHRTGINLFRINKLAGRTPVLAKFKHHLFICVNERDESAPRPSCGNSGSKKLKSAFKDAVKEAGLKGQVRANELGCLDQCEHGPVVVVYPDAVWYGFVHVKDVEEIVSEHLVHGRPVERLRLADTCLNTESCPHKPMPKRK